MSVAARDVAAAGPAGQRLRQALTTSAHRLARGAILRTADSELIERWMTAHGMRLGARRWVPAESLDEIVPVFRALNERGLRGVTGLFDDNAHDETTIARHEAEYARSIDRMAEERLDAYVGVKLTHLGAYVGEDAMRGAVGRLARRAGAYGMVLPIDMEHGALVQPTIDLYHRLRADGIDNVGLVLQAYLHRSPQDLEDLLPTGLHVRLVKGAYLEEPGVALQDRHQIDAAYVRLLERSLACASFTAIATHDPAIVDRAMALIDALGVPRSRYEFQALYNVGGALQQRIVAAGHPLRIGAPYGPTWFVYLTRRLAERPANLTFFLRNAFG